MTLVALRVVAVAAMTILPSRTSAGEPRRLLRGAALAAVHRPPCPGRHHPIGARRRQRAALHALCHLTTRAEVWRLLNEHRSLPDPSSTRSSTAPGSTLGPQRRAGGSARSAAGRVPAQLEAVAGGVLEVHREAGARPVDAGA